MTGLTGLAVVNDEDCGMFQYAWRISEQLSYLCHIVSAQQTDPLCRELFERVQWKNRVEDRLGH